MSNPPLRPYMVFLGFHLNNELNLAAIRLLTANHLDLLPQQHKNQT
jgi:hypothetical protein